MAGELTHIIPTHPSDPQYKASRTTGITWCDFNGNAHTIKAVYWSPTNNANDRKLIWQLSNDVPYDNTCIATITLSQDKTAWIVTVTKDSEDVTSSLSQITTWIYDGTGERIRPYTVNTNTIDLSQKPRGDYRVDLAQITSKAGGYFPGTGVISVPEHIYIGQLVAGDKCVAIELDLSQATEDLVINSIEIFSAETSNYTSAMIKIIHESGLFVAAYDGNTSDATSERYNLTGRARVNSSINTTLPKGKIYYVVFNDSNYQNYYPSYFANENGRYKEYQNTVAASSITPGDFSVLGNFLGAFGLNNQNPRAEDIEAMIAMNTNDSFVWQGSSQSQGWNPNLINNHFYRRESKTYTYTKTAEIPDNVGTAMYRLAKVLAALKGSNVTALQIGDIQTYFYKYVAIVNMKTGWDSYINSDSSGEPISLSDYPASPSKGLYYVNNEVQVYDGSNWQRPFQYDISSATVETYLNYPDWWYTDFEDMNYTASMAGDSFLNAEVKTTRKYYLRINGKEV